MDGSSARGQGRLCPLRGQSGGGASEWREGRPSAPECWRKGTLIEMSGNLFPDQAALAALCRRHHIRRLSLFGSTLKGTARPNSDVDLLVEFEPTAKPSLLTMAEIELELSTLLEGRRVDLRTKEDLSRYFRDDVVQMAEVQFAA